MKIGAHISVAGGIEKAIDRAESIGAETIQVFVSSPRAWKFRFPKEDDINKFREKSIETGIGPCYIHGSYLVNIGGAPELIEKSVKSLSDNMLTANNIGAMGVIFHGGSHKGKGFSAVLKQAATCLVRVLDSSPDSTFLIIENSAGMGSHIGSSFEELGELLKSVDHPNLKVCLDTEHCFAAGYNIASKSDLDSIIDNFDNEIGLDKLVAIHANDSKVELGSGVDRHENIGAGFIGIAGFENILSHPALQNIPFILEVPGFANNGPDKENLEILKGIRTKLGLGV